MTAEALFKRQAGETSRLSLGSAVAYSRRLGLELSQSRSIRSAHQGGVTWLDLDHVEQRYLLAGASDASVAVYDTQQQAAQQGQAEDGGSGGGGGSGSGAGTELSAVLHITRQTPGAHRFSVSSVAWYPVDTGLFVTGGYDNEVKVWDANSLAVAAAFSLSGRVHAVAMSPCATSHCLVAVGSAEPQVMLCDVTSGGFTHTLSGHRAAVWAVHWSLQTEWHLMTGGCDGQLRLWDIRRAGPLHIFDQHQTQRALPQLPRSGQGQSGTAAQRGVGSGAGSASANGGSRKRSSSSEPRGEQQGSRKSKAARGGSGAGSNGGNGAVSGGSRPLGRGGSAGGGPRLSSERMFLPDKVTRYASAHGGSITAVHPTPHGLYWLSAGTDDHVRLWDALTYRHLLVNYPSAFNRSLRARQLSVSEDSRMLFHPSGSAVQVYDVDSGRLLRTLQGAHFDTVNTCKWNPLEEELYTGSNDCHIVVWTPRAEDGQREEAGGGGGADDSDADNWSD